MNMRDHSLLKRHLLFYKSQLFSYNDLSGDVSVRKSTINRKTIDLTRSEH